ncbi:MAG: flagellar hook-length control protein FliK [bacterium]
MNDYVNFNPEVNSAGKEVQQAAQEANSGQDVSATKKNISAGSPSKVKLNPKSELPGFLKNNPGQKFEGRVVKSTGENEYLLEVNGEKITVETDFPLRKGDSITLQVEGEQGSGKLFMVGINSEAGGEILTTTQAMNFLDELSLPDSGEAVDLVKLLAGQGTLPGKNDLEELLKSISMLMDEKGKPSLSRIKSFVFLKQNELPVSRELIDILEVSDSREVLSQAASEDILPDFNPGKQHLAEHLREVISRLGLDLEKQLATNPGQAKQTARAQVAHLVLEMLGGGKSKSEAKKQAGNYGGIFRHSLASAVDEQSIFILVPFQTEEGPNFFQIHFQDERSNEEEAQEDKWSVKLQVNLSRLGEISVEGRRRDEKLKINLGAQAPEIVNLLRKNKERLREALAELGYKPAINCNRTQQEGNDLIEENLMKYAVENLHRMDFEA